MANTLRINTNIELRQTGIVLPCPIPAQTITLTGQLIQWDILTITTSEVTWSISGVSTPSYFWAINLDGTNYVQWGKTTTDYIGRMLALEVAHPFRLDNGVSNLYFKANTASCKIFAAVCQA